MKSVTTILNRVFVMLFIFSALAVPALAQGVRGQLVDAENKRPVPSALVLLIAQRGDTVARATSDSLGQFTILAPREGDYRMAIRRLGFKEAMTKPYPLTGRGLTLLTLEIAPLATRLESVRVRETNPREWGIDGFQVRRALGQGTFLNRIDIVMSDAEELNDLFWDVPGIQVRPDRGGLRVVSTEGNRCMITLVNRMPVVDYFETLPREVMGIEIYPSIDEVPLELQMYAQPRGTTPGAIASARGAVTLAPGGGCGLINIWTRASWCKWSGGWCSGRNRIIDDFGLAGVPSPNGGRPPPPTGPGRRGSSQPGRPIA